MAEAVITSNNQVVQWRRKVWKEIVRDMGYSRDIGDNENSIFQMVDDLNGDAGAQVRCALVHKLSGDGVEGDDPLAGNEEAPDTFSFLVTATQKRNGVAIGEAEQAKTFIEILDVYRESLKLWAAEDQDDEITRSLTNMSTTNTAAYADNSEEVKDAFLASQNPSTTNSRVLFGAAISNDAANDHSACLSQIDGTADDLSPDMLALIKRMVMAASPGIRPVKVDGGEWYKAYAHPRAFRDLELNMSTIWQNAAPRSLEDNPLFATGDIVSRGTIVHEVVRMTLVTGVGAGNIDVTPVPYCGAQAVVIANKRRPRPIKDDRDYDNIQGVGIAVHRGTAKALYGRTTDGADMVMHGMGVVWASAVGD